MVNTGKGWRCCLGGGFSMGDAPHTQKGVPNLCNPKLTYEQQVTSECSPQPKHFAHRNWMGWVRVGLHTCAV